MAVTNSGRVVTLETLELYNQKKTLYDDERYLLTNSDECKALQEINDVVSDSDVDEVIASLSATE